jgi:hypothetical protein
MLKAHLRRGLTAALTLLVAVGAAGLGLGLDARAVRGQDDDDLFDITLLYQSDVKGKIEPCG